MPEEQVVATGQASGEQQESPQGEALEASSRREPPEENLAGEDRRKRLKAEKEARDLRERLEALESKDQSELERERKAREKAELERQELASRVESLEKGGWVRDAAAAANFHNPSAAASFIDLSEIEDAKDAVRAVKDLAKREGYLVKAEDGTPPKIGQVLKDGQAAAAPASGSSAPGINLDEEAQMVAGQLKKFLDSRSAAQ